MVDEELRGLHPGTLRLRVPGSGKARALSQESRAAKIETIDERLRTGDRCVVAPLRGRSINIPATVQFAEVVSIALHVGRCQTEELEDVRR